MSEPRRGKCPPDDGTPASAERQVRFWRYLKAYATDQAEKAASGSKEEWQTRECAILCDGQVDAWERILSVRKGRFSNGKG